MSGCQVRRWQGSHALFGAPESSAQKASLKTVLATQVPDTTPQ